MQRPHFVLLEKTKLNLTKQNIIFHRPNIGEGGRIVILAKNTVKRKKLFPSWRSLKKTQLLENGNRNKTLKTWKN